MAQTTSLNVPTSAPDILRKATGPSSRSSYHEVLQLRLVRLSHVSQLAWLKPRARIAHTPSQPETLATSTHHHPVARRRSSRRRTVAQGQIAASLVSLNARVASSSNGGAVTLQVSPCPPAAASEHGHVGVDSRVWIGLVLVHPLLIQSLWLAFTAEQNTSSSTSRRVLNMRGISTIAKAYAMYLHASPADFAGQTDRHRAVTLILMSPPICPRQLQADFVWSAMVGALVARRAAALGVTAWLSTLGGAHSALGDHKHEHALEAGRLALQQLRVAIQLGDPGLVVRCRLFFAYCLIQLGQFKLAYQLIRFLRMVGKRTRDAKFLIMCRAALLKLQLAIQRSSIPNLAIE
ncbi:hypothetical protein CAOG_05556 [Capsaspora owczarzaki ATCC 30864]|uniref:Uncharacterized protein n=1 Tax=Capsaspora owczarzaki (strain ATCC 30864) TaxID=595528 RepID=A0A0D2WSE8_CAPO3|nr:hypothetical protein CAOG_05556 [Capsaspora owczarzaki ATCC 30864]KJE95060.1 hypothetical protein CAOG_005556 [Capsaspora owczarzaki ATCC 30864]|eukprot:XP_004346229.2 hypothetical protein CAOG_05556 [Capsaspora owczarzaki ATCC 30864]